MDYDDLLYNPFYHSLRNEFRRKYELAISKCWTICVPFSNLLRGLIITEEFVDDHILRHDPESQQHFISIGTEESQYKFEDMALELVKYTENERHKVRVISIEKGYNKDFQVYSIFVLDKPLLPKYTINIDINDNGIELNQDITSYKEALRFLNKLSDQAKIPLEELRSYLSKIDVRQFQSSEDLSSRLKDLTRRNWATIMRKHSVYLQRDARFQHLLSTSLEVFIMHCIHDKIYSLLSSSLEQEDLYVNKKLIQLADANVTPDQLGVDESLAIALPAAVVELATLDAREGPLEKLLCLRSTLDLIVAEVKAAIAEVRSKTDDNKVPQTDNLIPLLLYVIVKSRPSRLVTDLHYIHNFLWSISPRDGMSHSLATFEAAVEALLGIQAYDLPNRSSKVKTELPIAELMDIISRSQENVTPLDTQIHQLATMLEKCTQD